LAAFLIAFVALASFVVSSGGRLQNDSVSHDMGRYAQLHRATTSSMAPSPASTPSTTITTTTTTTTTTIATEITTTTPTIATEITTTKKPSKSHVFIAAIIYGIRHTLNNARLGYFVKKFHEESILRL
jgi:hypothetical protein